MITEADNIAHLGTAKAIIKGVRSDLYSQLCKQPNNGEATEEIYRLETTMECLDEALYCIDEAINS